MEESFPTARIHDKLSLTMGHPAASETDPVAGSPLLHWVIGSTVEMHSEMRENEYFKEARKGEELLRGGLGIGIAATPEGYFQKPPYKLYQMLSLIISSCILFYCFFFTVKIQNSIQVIN